VLPRRLLRVVDEAGQHWAELEVGHADDRLGHARKLTPDSLTRGGVGEGATDNHRAVRGDGIGFATALAWQEAESLERSGQCPRTRSEGGEGSDERKG